jgi:hypothetical protein
MITAFFSYYTWLSLFFGSSIEEFINIDQLKRLGLTIVILSLWITNQVVESDKSGILEWLIAFLQNFLRNHKPNYISPRPDRNTGILKYSYSKRYSFGDAK